MASQTTSNSASASGTAASSTTAGAAPPGPTCNPWEGKACSRCRVWRTRLWFERYPSNDPENLKGKGLSNWRVCNRCQWQKSGLPPTDWVEIHCSWLFDDECPCHWGEYDAHDYELCPNADPRAAGGPASAALARRLNADTLPFLTREIAAENRAAATRAAAGQQPAPASTQAAAPAHENRQQE